MSEVNEQEVNAEELMKELDKDSAGRNLFGKRKTALDVLFVLFAVVMITLTLIVSGMTPQTLRPLFVGLVLFIGYLKFPASKKDSRIVNSIPWYDIALAFLSLAVYLYFPLNQNHILIAQTQIGTVDIIVGIIGFILLAELCRRSLGLPMLIVAGGFIIYAVIYKVSINPPTALRNIIFGLFYDVKGGVFSTPIDVCSSFIVLFIILGSFLEKTGIGKFFVDLSSSVAGFAAGGPAKVAVISSALEGMYSGSSVANTVGSGSVTIPTMKKIGYKPEFAAAVEAAASTGGQIMPPIMGAAAFLMSEITHVPYSTIVIAAILPAVLYFTGIFLMVHFEAKRLGLKGLPKDAIPNFFKLILENGYLLLPVVVLVVCMNHFTAGMSACFAILFALVVSLIDKKCVVRLFKLKLNGIKDVITIILPLVPVALLYLLWKVIKLDMGLSVFISMLAAVLCSVFPNESILNPPMVAEGLSGGTNSSIGVAVACGMAGIVSGVVTMTGLGSTLMTLLLPIAEKSSFIALFLTMICCILLGMGVPTTANYVIMATIMAPILVKMGVPLLAAHMFVFYFGIVADITPPVALAAYAGAAIAKSNPLKTGVTATKLAITAFIIPYIFAYSPQMLLVVEGYTPSFFSIVTIIFTSIVGCIALSSGLEGYLKSTLKWWERIALIGAGLCLIVPDLLSDGIGLAVVVIIAAIQFFFDKNREKNKTAE